MKWFNHVRMEDMITYRLFPYGKDHDNKLDQLKHDHPQWMVKPWLFSMVVIQSDHDIATEYDQWLLLNHAYSTVLGLYGLTTVLSALGLIVVSLTLPVLSMELLLGLMILVLVITMGSDGLTIVIDRFKNIRSRHTLLISSVFLLFIIWFLPGLWFKLIALQSLGLTILWFNVSRFAHWFAYRPLYKYVKILDKLKNGSSACKQTDGSYENQMNATIGIDDEIALKRGETIPFDGIVIHGNAVIEPWMNHMQYAISANDSIHAGSRIVDGSITLKVVNSIDHSLFDQQLHQLVTSSMVEPNDTVDALIAIGFILITIVALLLYGCNGMTMVILMNTIVLLTGCKPVSSLSAMHRLHLKDQTRHGILFNGPLDDQTIHDIDHVIIDTALIHGLNQLEVDQVWLTKDVDHTLFFHMILSAIKKENDPASKAIEEYIRNQNIKDTDIRLSQSIYKKGLDNLLHGQTIHYGDLATLKNRNVDTSIVLSMDEDLRNHGSLMRYLAIDQTIIAIFKLKPMVYPRYQQLVQSLKSHGYTTILYDHQSIDGLNHLQTIYGFDQSIHDSTTLIDLIHKDQIDHHRYSYIHGKDHDPILITHVDLSISFNDPLTLDDMMLDNFNPLVIVSWLTHQHRWFSHLQRFRTLWPWIIIMAMGLLTLLMPMSGYIIESTWIILVLTIVDLLILSGFFYRGYPIESLQPDHSKHLTLKIDGITTHDHDRVQSILIGLDPTIHYRWMDETTLSLECAADLSRYTICQTIRSNGFAPRLIHTKNEK